MIIQEAIQKLKQYGLDAELVNVSEPRIIGGTSRTNELGFNVYTNSFTIYPENDLWVVVVTGPGQLDTEKKANNLSHAVAITCELYASKQEALSGNYYEH